MVVRHNPAPRRTWRRPRSGHGESHPFDPRAGGTAAVECVLCTHRKALRISDGNDPSRRERGARHLPSSGLIRGRLSDQDARLGNRLLANVSTRRSRRGRPIGAEYCRGASGLGSTGRRRVGSVDVGRRCRCTRADGIGLRPVVHHRRARSRCGATGGPCREMGARRGTVDVRAPSAPVAHRLVMRAARRATPRCAGLHLSEQTAPRLGADPPPHQQAAAQP